MAALTPIIIGLFISGVISILGSPVLGYIWGPVNPASTVFSIMAIALRFSKKSGEEFKTLLAIIGGIFLFDFFISKFYVDPSPGSSSGTILLLGSLLILALTVSFVPVIGLLGKDDHWSIVFYSGIMAFVIYVYGIIYGGITPGVSDGPKLAAIVSIILIKLKKEEELNALWNALFVIGVLGNFIIPAISLVGLIGETL